MSTDWIASVRPVKSTKSVILRTIGLLTGIVAGTDDATCGARRAQPQTKIARTTHGKTRRKGDEKLMGWHNPTGVGWIRRRKIKKNRSPPGMIVLPCIL